MAYDREQFRDLIRRTLRQYRIDTESAVNLLLGTAAVESGFGTFLRQKGHGPALGAFQMEPATFADLRGRFVSRFPFLLEARVEQLETNISLAIIMARIKYLSISAPLPDALDVEGLGGYWKNFYNSPAGAGTVEGFIEAWHRYVKL